jgi:translocator protein
VSDVASTPSEHGGRPSRLSLPLFMALALALSLLGLLTTTPLASGWYTAGPSPDWTPQTWVFALGWTVVYVLDGSAGWLLWRRRAAAPYSSGVLLLYWVQIGLQALWLIGFMAQGLVAGAGLWLVFAVIVALDVVTLVAATTAWPVSRAAAVLLMVVLAWLLLGTALAGAATLLRIGVG